MVGRPRQVTDDEILDAVAQTVSVGGPAKLTVAEVAARIGVTAPAVRQRFGSKRDLLCAFAARAAATATDTFDAVAASAEDPLAGLLAGLAAYGSFTDRTEMAHHLAMLQLDLTDPELSRSASQHSRRLRSAVRSQIDRAAESGQLDTACDLAELADSVYTTFNGALLTWAIDGNGTSSEWVTERLRRVIQPYLVGHRASLGSRGAIQ
jgi:AcrR family transcriptional regulator